MFKPKKVPSKILKFMHKAYEWGYSDREKGLSMKTLEEVSESINKGYSQGIAKRKN